jgi:two-component SAPR family response regulator
MNGFDLYEAVRKIDNKVKACFLTAFGEGYTEEFKKDPNIFSFIL